MGLGNGIMDCDQDWRLGIGIGIGNLDWGFGLDIGIGNWDWYCGFLIEIVIQIFSFIAIIVFYCSQTETTATRAIMAVDYMSLCIFIRILTLYPLLLETKDFQTILETGKRLAMPFLSVLFALYLTMMIFEAICAYFLSGIITYDVDVIQAVTNDGGNTLYFLLNFNDFYSGQFTLFSFAPANNWNSFVDMYTTIYDGRFPKIIFSIYFIIMVPRLILQVVYHYISLHWSI